MFATLATIKVAHLVVNGTAMPANMPFVDAGNAIVKALGEKAANKLFKQCAAACAANPYPATYEYIAQQVIALRTNA